MKQKLDENVFKSSVIFRYLSKILNTFCGYQEIEKYCTEFRQSKGIFVLIVTYIQYLVYESYLFPLFNFNIRNHASRNLLKIRQGDLRYMTNFVR